MLRRATVGMLSALLGVASGGCGGGSPEQGVTFDPSLRGGALTVGISRGAIAPGWLDPSAGLNLVTVELFRCCLLRTLVSYTGTTTAEGGAVTRPDLASADPVLAANGLTWTFHLKPGIHYAPPYEGRTVTSEDVVRGIERTLRFRPSSYEAQFFEVITGATAFESGRSESVSGLETPDPMTLVIRLNERVGDLANRLALPGAAPVPPGLPRRRLRPEEIPATGPYRIADYHDERIILVRNPSWDPASDALRPAYADRITVTVADDAEQLVDWLDRGRVDLPLFATVVPELAAPPDDVRRYLASPELRGQVHGASGAAARAVTMNLALRPFDDVHVRRAVNLVIDRAALLAADPLSSGRPATHIVPDALEQDLLLDYDPYRARAGSDRVARARAEMARSRYDDDGDGICDSAACREVLAATRNEPVYRRQAAIVAKDLKALGITLRTRVYDPSAYFGHVLGDRPQIPLLLPVAWIADYASASAYFDPLFYGPSFDAGLGNPSLVGARPGVLRRLGYEHRHVPSIDVEIQECNGEVGGDAFACWARADMVLTEKIAAWVPYDFPRNVELVGPRLTAFSWDQSSGTPLPALDRVAIR